MQESRADRRRLPPGPAALATALSALGLWSSLSSAAAPPQPPSFGRDVAPVFERWCVNCHGPREQHGGLRLDEYVWVMRGGDTGPAVVLGNSKRSLLLAKIEHRSRPAMPPRQTLPARLVARLRAWIAAGAPP